MATKQTLIAARNVPFEPTINFYYSGGDLPLTGATIKMQVRLYAGAPGDPLADLTSVSFDDTTPTDEEIAENSLDADFRVLRIYPEIDETTLAAFPTGLNAPEVGQADQFFYDVVIEYSDGKADRPIAGPFLLEPGVTD